jgi:hypothetical protein
VVVLVGEWVPAWLWMSITFFVALTGVSVLGWWVLRGDAINRKGEESIQPEGSTPEHH